MYILYVCPTRVVNLHRKLLNRVALKRNHQGCEALLGCELSGTRLRQANNDGPELGSNPKENTAGKIANPANNDTKVSEIITLAAFPYKLLSLV